MSKENQENVFNLLYLFKVVQKYLWYIIGVVGFAAIMAFILTMPFIYPPEYQSSAIVYPTSPERYDVVNLFHHEPTLFLYGESKEVEKLDNITNSEEVKMYVIDSLNLWEPYGVNPKTDASPKFYVLRTYDGMVSTVRISGNGLLIQAYDVEPQRAADIVNLLIYKIDQVNKRTLLQNKSSILKMYREGYKHLESQLLLYTDSLRSVRKRYNVFNTEYQTEALVDQVMTAEAEAAATRTRARIMEASFGKTNSETRHAEEEAEIARSRVYALTRQSSGTSINLEGFREGLDQVLALEEVCEYLARDLKEAREKVEYLDMMSQTDFSTLVIPGYAQPADKKARPVRWVILVATLLLAGMVSVMGAVLVEKITESVGGNSD
ncbi:MAG: Wzz/FepE/Etk N-terminal domain-containing protein [Bacteroidia bacterium]|nr:Wzz/FepE/Etk N-terminal domain-containing protein [Bacteroidia bacterium]